jgi:ubiquinone/menaquinone biosynthesis C-methylase UbiE
MSSNVEKRLRFPERCVKRKGYTKIHFLCWVVMYFQLFDFVVSFPVCPSGYDQNILCHNEKMSRNDNPTIILYDTRRPDLDETTSHGETNLLSRRDLFSWRIPLVGIGAFAYSNLVVKAISFQDIAYPEPHESRVRSVISTAFMNAAATLNDESYSKRPFRILEIGIGRNCRLIRRGLYDSAIHNLVDSFQVSSIELTGVDFRLPDDQIYQESRKKLDQLQKESQSAINFQTINGSITSSSTLPWEDGYFDSIICCLTLCSVDDIDAAIQGMKRLLRPHGGTLGYVEHVAVNDSELNEHGLLEFQQRLLDPSQQRLVDNCHLHRYTDESFMRNFEHDNVNMIQQERFYVDNMWPVSCQCCGVIQSR